MYRQGDILLVPVTSIPEGTVDVELELDKHILAHGEVTGHHHSFTADAPVAFMELLDTGDRYLEVTETAPLTHQEHATIPVAPGKYQVIRQREYDDSEEWRYVAD